MQEASTTPLSNETGRGGAARTLQVLASFVVVVAGLKLAADLLLPIVSAAFVAVVALPVSMKLRAWGMPKALAIGLTLLVAVAALALFTSLLASSVASFSQALPEMRRQFDAQVGGWARSLEDLGWSGGGSSLRDKFDPKAVLNLVTQASEGILSVLSSFVVILLLTIFALVEADEVPQKLRHALGEPQADLELYRRMAVGVGEYAFWKTLLNAVTGGLVALLCWGFGVPEPLLWGLVAFLFNFVPTLGSLIVAVPIVLLALAEGGASRALLVALVYLGVNQAIGSVVEPRLMGRKFGLSPLVVLLSLLFWGWLWGPVGMLLSVPLTMMARLMLLRTRDGRALGVLLGPALGVERPTRG